MTCSTPKAAPSPSPNSPPANVVSEKAALTRLAEARHPLPQAGEG